jgi:PAS domain S-box-containing protein
VINLFDASLLLTFLSIALAGAVVWLLVLKKQVTERVNQVERELAKRKRADVTIGNLGEFLDKSSTPFVRVFADGTILYHNKAGSALLEAWGYWKNLPPSSYWYGYMVRALGSGRPQQGEIKCGNRMFSLTFASSVGSTYVDVQGLDITERKRAEKMLRKRAEQFRAIAGYSYDLESWRGPDGHLVWLNPAVTRLTGYSVQECMAMPHYPLPLIHEEDREDVGRVIHQFVEERTSGNDLPFRIRRKDGSVIWAAISWQPIYSDKGEYSGIRSSIRDITERKQAEEQIERQNAVLTAINEVFQEALTCETEADVARTCLVVAEKLTGSKFGFIGELNEASLFDTIAISNPGWDACKMPDSDATRLIKNMEIRGIDRSTLREGKSRIVNNPPSHPDHVVIPEGHPQITCFLGVPLKQAGKTIGMIGLANKESGYDLTDQEAIETLSIPFLEALMRKRAERKARNH